MARSINTMRTVPVAVPRPASGRRLRWLKFIMGTVSGLAMLGMLPIIIVLGIYAYYRVSGFVLPGVRVGEVPVQNLTINEVVAELDRVWNIDYRITAVDIMDPTRSWIVAPSEFGLRVDAQASSAYAYDVGRGQGLVDGPFQMMETWRDGREIIPVVTFDPIIGKAGLEIWADRVNIPSVEGALTLEGGNVVQVQGRSGKFLDVEASLSLLAADPASVMLDYQFVPLVMNTAEPVIIDVSGAANYIESMLGSELRLSAYDPVTDELFHWSPTREEIASWLRIERDQREFRVEIDFNVVMEYLADLDTSLGEYRDYDLDKALAAVQSELQGGSEDTLIIRYRPTPYIVRSTDNLVSISYRIGKPYWKILEENPNIVEEGLVVGKTLSIPPADAMLSLPVVMNKRIVISISEQLMWVYQDGELIREHVISTGVANSPTMPGIFQVQSHFLNAYGSRWDLYMPHFLGIYDATPGFTNGIHGLPILSNGKRLWGSVLGRPASYGCIILDLDAAEQLYIWAEDGVVVEIQR